MFDYFKKHKRITDDDSEQRVKPKKDKVFIAILIIFSIIHISCYQILCTSLLNLGSHLT